jgi:hypothetical protein
VYTKAWHNFKRLARKICTFFAGCANWLCRATYDVRSAAATPGKVSAARQPTLKFMLLDPVHVATFVMFFVICAIAGEFALAGRRPK